MAKACTANYVDRLLVKLNGALCPIWNSLFFSVEDLPDAKILFDVMNALINEAPRLKSIWSEQGSGWKEIEPDEQSRVSAFVFDDFPRERMERIHHLIETPIVLDWNLPLRISVGKTRCNQGRSWLIGFQLHHAAGDGRALIHLIQRYWALLNLVLYQEPLNCASLTGPQMTDRKIINKVWSHKKVLPYLMKSKYRQLSRRADALHHVAGTTGSPILKTCRIDLANPTKYNSSELFYSAILAAIVQTEADTEEKLLRFRIPVDLRHFLAIPANTVENGCAAVVLELSLKKLRDLHQNKPNQLGAFLRDALSKSLKAHIYLSNALECLLVSRLSNAKKLKRAARAELLASKRSSTMVITHFGDLTPYLKPPTSIKILTIQSHTPVWGSNSLVYDGSLYLTVTCFNGIWNDEQMNHFTAAAKGWLGSLYGLSGELL